MFSERREGMGIIFVENHGPGGEIKSTISLGDEVTLRIGKERVLVRNVVAIGPQRYKGEVYGFEPSLALEFHGIALEQDIEFNESQVFGCSCR